MPKKIDLTEQRFEMLTAKKKVGLNKNGNVLWECECDCGNIVVIPATYLRRGVSYSCGCTKRLSKRVEDLTDKKIGKLKVIELGKDMILPSGRRIRRWKCQCDCGKTTLVIHQNLVNKTTKSCGCLIGGKSGKRKENTYEIIGDYAYIQIGNTNQKATCDKDMVESLKQYYWYIGNDGYAYTMINKKTIKMHKLIVGEHCGEVIDHINRNKLDNRRENLRSTTYSMNNFNQKSRGNVSGTVGVYRIKNKWRSTITVNGKNIHIGYFDNINEAVQARKQAELKYYGELKDK